MSNKIDLVVGNIEHRYSMDFFKPDTNKLISIAVTLLQIGNNNVNAECQIFLNKDNTNGIDLTTVSDEQVERLAKNMLYGQEKS